MENALSSLTALLPVQLEFSSMLKFIGMVAVAVLIIGLIARMLLGSRSGLNQAVCAAIGILFVYALSIVIYTFNPADLAKHLAPLPFVSFKGETLRIFSFSDAAFPAICAEFLSIVILAFLVNLLDHLIPTGKSAAVWFLLRILTVLAATVIHIVVSVALETYVAGVIITYAPMILLCLLLALLFLGLLKGILALVLATVNPIIGAISAFFFGNVIGKQLGKAVMTAGMIGGAAYALEHYGFGVISIAAAALVSYIPLIIVLLVLWYFIDRVL